jgi:hypothetical protein
VDYEFGGFPVFDIVRRVMFFIHGFWIPRCSKELNSLGRVVEVGYIMFRKINLFGCIKHGFRVENSIVTGLLVVRG